MAVLVSNIYGSMIYEQQEGLIDAARELDIKLIFLTSFSDGFSSEFYDKYVKYDEGDLVSFLLTDLNDFDGIVILSDSFSVEYKNRLNRLLENVTIPIMNIGSNDCKTYYNLENVEDRSFSSVVEHVITEHGCKDIYHVAGRKISDFTYDRINAFKLTLQRYGLPCDNERIYFGTLWKDTGKPALEYILKKCAERGTKYPDAIICANDYMAIGVVDACKEKGIRVPADIIVTGYDGIAAASEGRPTITTSRQPFHEKAALSLKLLTKIWNNEEIGEKVTAEGELILNQSCGCKSLDLDDSNEIRYSYSEKMDKMEYLAQSTTNMILSLSNSSTLEEAFDEIGKNAQVDTGFKDFFLCLAPDWDKQRVVNDLSNMEDEEMTVVAGFRKEGEVKKVTFRRKQLLPDELLNDPNPYYIFAVHHLQYYMGYIIVSPNLRSYNQLIMKSWLVNLGAMLENWRIRQKLNETVDRLEDLYNRDMLTGLYNRRGYDLFFKDYYKRSLWDQTDLAVLVIDMDDLKLVNDTYGHNEGDYSLCTISEALTKSVKYDEICMRTGGDEFVVIATDYSREKADKYIKSVRKYIEEKTSKDKKEYPLTVSVGTCITIPEEGDERDLKEIAEGYIRIADEEMYKEKKKKKKGR